ncbi:MAG: response regulator [Elusimicrobia bacterium]|nr:response regulator [Elusimicrobiota bacterium]
MPEPARPAGRSVVIVEDEPDILESMEALLRHNGYAVQTSSRGDEGLALVLRDRPGLVVLDVMLPGMTGHEVCRALKGSAATRAIPVLLLSALAQKNDVDAGLACGADRYLTKPYRNEDLLRAVADLLP